jgi:hypothetical protein
MLNPNLDTRIFAINFEEYCKSLLFGLVNTVCTDVLYVTVDSIGF